MKRVLTRTLIAETLECMRIWDSLEEIGDCLVWTGSVNKYGYPQYKSSTENKCRLVRRMAWKFAGGTINYRVPLGCKCGDRKCVNPEHLYQSSTQAIAKKAAQRGAWSSVTRAAKIAATKRAKGKLTMEQAREIRLSNESGPALAAIYGVNKSLINGIKSGRNWREYANSNPFAALMR